MEKAKNVPGAVSLRLLLSSLLMASANQRGQCGVGEGGCALAWAEEALAEAGCSGDAGAGEGWALAGVDGAVGDA